MEKKEEVKATAKVKVAKSAGVFVAVKGIELKDGKRFEIGEQVSGLAPAEIAALKEMEAIVEEGK